MFTVKLSQSDFKDPAKWQQLIESLELPEGRTEVIVTRIPGLVPVEEGWRVDAINKTKPDEWLLGENINGKRQYVIHTYQPRFIAELLNDTNDLRLVAFQYQLNSDQWLSDFIWFDPPPEDLTALLNEAEQFIEQYDSNLGVD